MISTMKTFFANIIPGFKDHVETTGHTAEDNIESRDDDTTLTRQNAVCIPYTNQEEDFVDTFDYSDDESEETVIFLDQEDDEEITISTNESTTISTSFTTNSTLLSDTTNSEIPQWLHTFKNDTQSTIHVLDLDFDNCISCLGDWTDRQVRITANANSKPENIKRQQQIKSAWNLFIKEHFANKDIYVLSGSARYDYGRNLYNRDKQLNEFKPYLNTEWSDYCPQPHEVDLFHQLPIITSHIDSIAQSATLLPFLMPDSLQQPGLAWNNPNMSIQSFHTDELKIKLILSQIKWLAHTRPHTRFVLHFIDDRHDILSALRSITLPPLFTLKLYSFDWFHAIHTHSYIPFKPF